MGFRGQNLGLGRMWLKFASLGSIMPKKAPIDLSNRKNDWKPTFFNNFNNFNNLLKKRDFMLKTINLS
jgi:hypothetical protein